MIVVITSWAPTVARRNPAMPPQRAPASAAAATARSTCGTGDSEANQIPICTPTMLPTMYCPWPPMLKSPQRKANATASPVRTSVVVRISVCCRFCAGTDAVSHGNHTRAFVKGTPISYEPTWKNQFRPVPLKISW
jgi:hypothetical protein